MVEMCGKFTEVHTLFEREEMVFQTLKCFDRERHLKKKKEIKPETDVMPNIQRTSEAFGNTIRIAC